MDVREKLVELLKEVVAIQQCGFGDPRPTYETAARYLISHGVTMQKLNGCKYCKEYEDLPEHFIEDKPVGRVFDTCIQPNENGLWHIEVPCGTDIGIRFCPMCGRRLPQPPKGE